MDEKTERLIRHYEALALRHLRWAYDASNEAAREVFLNEALEAISQVPSKPLVIKR